MSYKHNKASFNRLSKVNTSNNTVSTVKVTRVPPKRVVISKKLGTCSEKSCSAGIITTESNPTKPKKTTKSDASLSTKTGKSLDYCKKCGDAVSINIDTVIAQYNSTSTNNPNVNSRSTSSKNETEITFKSQEHIGERNGKRSKENGSVKQYYKNENFPSTESVFEAENEFKKISLDTIKELPETRPTSDNIKPVVGECNVYEVYSDSEEVGCFDVNDKDNIDNLKKFRNANYFECHSVKSRMDGKEKISATGLINHKCVYRFYLNDRLFPVPLSTDHHDNVRCVECHLPMHLNLDSNESKANGTIQAKVRLGAEKDAQDMILFLPVKDSLIIKERRRQMKEEDEVVYFGVIKLDNFGNSVFNSTLPTDSLALKYQKGYKEHASTDTYKYRGVEKSDVIII